MPQTLCCGLFEGVYANGANWNTMGKVTPFIIQANTREITEVGKFVLTEGIMLPSVVKLDNAKCVKIFNNADNRKVVMALSSAGKSVFLSVLYSLDYGSEKVTLRVRRLMRECFISSHHTFTKGIEELERYGIIAATDTKYEYWINSAIFFAGDRLKLSKTKK